MSFCRKEGKDKIIFVTEEYLETPSNTVLLPDNPDEVDTSNVGAILPNGEINWDCPCLGNLPNGPCGQNFRDAFSCWVENRNDEATFAEKCWDNFTKWEGCISEHRDIYRPSGDDDTSVSATDLSESTVIKENEALPYKDNEAVNNNIEESEPKTSGHKEDSNRAIAAASTSK
ncbi:mitochondrial intermembrane space import and assembly protein 40-like [Clavelina lepadiformis]|uniref:Mitochondrial intermembrane space import and assembly protein 40 n=1 Tax=Clavelina lepadiformis TaxID=159417 RepID=A0ABP0GCZ0_CLALP